MLQALISNISVIQPFTVQNSFSKVGRDRPHHQEPDPGSVTGVLRKADPVWWWLRENFRLPSLVAIGGFLVTSGAWIYAQHLDLDQLRKHDPGPKLEEIAGQLSAVLQAESAMKARLEDFGERIDRQEARWERVDQVAEAMPGPRRKRDARRNPARGSE